MHLSLLLLRVQQCAPMSMECNCFIYLLRLSCFSDVLTRRTWIMKWKECRRVNFSQFHVVSRNFHGASEKKKDAIKWRFFIIQCFTAWTVHRWANILNGVVASSPRNESVLHFVMEAGSFVTVAPKYLDTATFSNNLITILALWYIVLHERDETERYTPFSGSMLHLQQGPSKWLRFPFLHDVQISLITLASIEQTRIW